MPKNGTMWMIRSAVAIAFTPALAAQCPMFGGLCFPQGRASFADAVLEYDTNGCAFGTNAPGCNGAVSPQNMRIAALGPPDSSIGPCTQSNQIVSLGHGGRIELAFLDNTLTNSGDAGADLHVFEVGGVTESFFVALRPADAQTLAQVTAVLADANGDGYYEIPDAVRGQPTSIDLDGLWPSAPAAGSLRFDAVQITDDEGDSYPGECMQPWPGADIDAVGGISSTRPTYPGSNDDLFLLTGINGSPPTTGPGRDIKSIAAHDFVEVRLESPAATHLGDPPVVFAQAFSTGAPPLGTLPGLHVELSAATVLVNGWVSTPLGWAQVIAPTGNSWFLQIPAAVPLGASVMIQGAVISSSAQNGAFGLTDGHELRR